MDTIVNKVYGSQIIDKRFKFIRPTREMRQLQILNEINRNPDVSQRSLAKVALISSTMVNNYIMELVASGSLLVSGDSNRKFTYHLTEDGKKQKNDLFFHASKEIIQFYGIIKNEFKRRLEYLHNEEGINKVVLFGAAETGDLVLNVSKQTLVQVIGIVDNFLHKQGKRLGEHTIQAPSVIEQLKPDAVVITSFGYMDEIFNQMNYLEDKGIKVRKLIM